MTIQDGAPSRAQPALGGPPGARPSIVRRVWRHASIEAGTVTFGRFRDLAVVAVLCAIVIPRFAAIVVPVLTPFTPRVDPRGYWFLQTAHQLSSLALTLAVMKLLSERSLADWGLNVRRAGRGLSMALVFAVLATPPLFLLMDAQPAPTSSISATEMAVVLLTHFVIIGTTQEVLFRGFAMTFLARQWPGVLRLGRLELPIAGLWAAVIFTLAHVKPSIWPAQIAASFVFGVLYAVIFHRTGSLLGPSVAHGYSNTGYVAMMLAKYWV